MFLEEKESADEQEICANKIQLRVPNCALVLKMGLPYTNVATGDFVIFQLNFWTGAIYHEVILNLVNVKFLWKCRFF